MDEIAAYAGSIGLDFVHISDHNTVSQATFMNDVQTRFPNLLIFPGTEWTTYNGHAGAIGIVNYTDHKVYVPFVCFCH